MYVFFWKTCFEILSWRINWKILTWISWSDSDAITFLQILISQEIVKLHRFRLVIKRWDFQCLRTSISQSSNEYTSPNSDSIKPISNNFCKTSLPFRTTTSRSSDAKKNHWPIQCSQIRFSDIFQLNQILVHGQRISNESIQWKVGIPFTANNSQK